MIPIYGKLKIDITTLLLIALAIVFDFYIMLAAVYIFVLAHELAHFAMAAARRVPVREICIMPFGITIQLDYSGINSTKHELFIAAAGPLCSIALAALFFYLYHRCFYTNATLLYYAVINVAVGVINLLPALPLDGGRVLRAYLADKLGVIRAYNISSAVTKAVIVIIAAAGVGVLIYTRFNFSLLVIAAFLFSNMIQETRLGKLPIMHELYKSRGKLGNSAHHVSHIAIQADAPARKLLKLIGFNKYYIINIVDKDMRLTRTITETQLISGLIKHGIRAKAGEL